MIIIGEKINGTIPSVKKAIGERDADFIMSRAVKQAQAGASFIDVCASTSSELEYDALVWLIGVVQSAVETPLCVDSPNELLLKRIYEEGLVKIPGMLNSVNEEGTKCETIFPLIAGTPWQVVGLTCDKDGIPSQSDKKVDIAKSMIDKAVKYGVDLKNFHIDPCVMALATAPGAMLDFEYCIARIKEYAPEVKITGAISNISFDMPLRKLINQNCMALAIRAGLDSAIADPTDRDMMGVIYAAEALSGIDKSGRKFNRAFRAGKIGPKKG
ncbi:MAG: dihydropteroate synthase [Eubacteriaceae bacterium]|nr:dihydropteroate synthase [Eubacteriaceae bacterium]